jgi:hypothetical protein
VRSKLPFGPDPFLERVAGQVGLAGGFSLFGFPALRSFLGHTRRGGDQRANRIGDLGESFGGRVDVFFDHGGFIG